MYVLDTDILSLVHAGNEQIEQRSRQIDSSQIATTIITKIEILRARHDFMLKASDGGQLLQAQYWLGRSEDLLADLRVLGFESTSAAVFDALRQRKKLKKIGRADLLIASIVLDRRDVLVTRNVRHFQQIPELKLENWAD